MNKQNRITKNKQEALNIVKKAVENDSDILICTKENIIVNGNTVTLIKLIGDAIKQLIKRTDGELNFAIAIMLKNVLKYIKED